MNCLCFLKTISLLILLFLAVLGLCCCMWAFCSRGEQGLLLSCGVQASRCRGFSCCKERALEPRLSSFDTRAYLPSNMWNLPRGGIERVSPALTADSQPLIIREVLYPPGTRGSNWRDSCSSCTDHRVPGSARWLPFCPGVGVGRPPDAPLLSRGPGPKPPTPPSGKEQEDTWGRVLLRQCPPGSKVTNGWIKR